MRGLRRFGSLRYGAQALLPAFVFLCAMSITAQSTAQPLVVRVELLQYRPDDCSGFDPGLYDVYFRVKIDGEWLGSREDQVSSAISPTTVYREFSKGVDLSQGTIGISLAQWDADDNADDHCDISSLSGNNIDITLDLAACILGPPSLAFTGELSGSCDVLAFEGSQPDGFTFRVSVDPPASAPGELVRCIHDPIWPQPNDTVTITAESLDGTLSPRFATSVQIWVDNQAAPVASQLGDSLTTTVGPFTNASDFNYSCLVEHNGRPTVWTTWRRVAVGSTIAAEHGGMIPVVYTGARSSRIDVAFHADAGTYGSVNAAFLAAVHGGILNGYYSEEVFLRNHDKLNFWIFARSWGR